MLRKTQITRWERISPSLSSFFCPSAPIRQNPSTANPCFPIEEFSGPGQSQVKRLQIALGLYICRQRSQNDTYCYLFNISLKCVWHRHKNNRGWWVSCATCLRIIIVHIVQRAAVCRFGIFKHSAHGVSSFKVRFTQEKATVAEMNNSGRSDFFVKGIDNFYLKNTHL